MWGRSHTAIQHLAGAYLGSLGCNHACKLCPCSVAKLITNSNDENANVEISPVSSLFPQVEITSGHRSISVHIAQMTAGPQLRLCGHCVQTYPIAIAVCIVHVVQQIACGSAEIVVYIRTTTC